MVMVALRSHIGWKRYDVRFLKRLGEAAKAAVMYEMNLTEPHEMELCRLEKEYGSGRYVYVFHLPRSAPPPQAGITPGWARKSAGDPWFTTQYASIKELQSNLWFGKRRSGTFPPCFYGEPKVITSRDQREYLDNRLRDVAEASHA